MSGCWISSVSCGCLLTDAPEDTIRRDAFGADEDCPVCGAIDAVKTEWETDYDLDAITDEDEDD